MSARLIDTVKFESPLSKLAVSSTSQYIAVATARLDSYNSVFIIGDDSHGDVSSVASDCVIRQVPSLFPPSTIALNPTSATAGSGFTLAVAGEAIALWDTSEELLAYCVPELFASHSRYDIAGVPASTNETPVWSITHLEWNKYQPTSLLACHRSGPLCLYPIQRLPSAQKSWMDLSQRSSSPNASLMQIAKKLASKVFAPGSGTYNDGSTEGTPTASTGRKSGANNRAAAGPHYEVVAQPLVKTPLSPSTTSSPVSNPRYFTCARFFGSPSITVAAKAGSASLQMFDLRQKPETVAWDTALTGISKICVEPSDNPVNILGLDKQCGIIYVFDSRKHRDGGLEAFATYNVSDLFDDSTIINDISWSEKDQDQIYVGLQHKECEPSKWQPVAQMSASMIRNEGSQQPRFITFSGESATYSNRFQSSSVVSAVEALSKNKFAALRMMGDIKYDTEDGDIVQIVPPPNATAPLRNMRFITNKGWQLSVVELEAT